MSFLFCLKGGMKWKTLKKEGLDAENTEENTEKSYLHIELTDTIQMKNLKENAKNQAKNGMRNAKEEVKQMNNAQKRAELWCESIDNVKALKLLVDDKETISQLDKVEQGLNNLLNAEIVKD